MSPLEAVEVGLMDADGLLELLDVFGASLTESGLSLTVALLTFLGGGIDLGGSKACMLARCLVLGVCTKFGLRSTASRWVNRPIAPAGDTVTIR